MAGLVIYDQSGNASVWGSISSGLDAAIRSASHFSDQQGNSLNVESFIPGVGVVALGAPGSGYLVNGCPLNVWFGGAWLPGQQDALKPYGLTQCIPQVNVPQTGSTVQGGLTTFTMEPGKSNAVNSDVSAAISASVTPGAPGSLPGSGASTQFPALGAIYRFILNSGPGLYDTGANYPGCSQVNTAQCDPQGFSTLQDAVDYAHKRGEIPYIATSAAEVWGIINGTVALDSSKIYGQGGGISLGLVTAVIAGIALLRR